MWRKRAGANLHCTLHIILIQNLRGGRGMSTKNGKLFNYFPFCCVEFSFPPSFFVCLWVCFFHEMQHTVQSGLLTPLNWIHLPNAGNVTQSLWEPWTYDSHLMKRSKYSFLQHANKQFSSCPARSQLEQVKASIISHLNWGLRREDTWRASLCVKNLGQLLLLSAPDTWRTLHGVHVLLLWHI